MIDECDICGKEDTLCDAVYEHRPVKVCSYCKTTPEMLIIEKPSQDKLNRVYERYSFSSKARQEIRDRTSSASASAPLNFRGHTLEEIRKIRQETEVQKKPEVNINSSADVESEDLNFKPKSVRIVGIKEEIKDEFNSAN
jgi:hypothetical protein